MNELEEALAAFNEMLRVQKWDKIWTKRLAVIENALSAKDAELGRAFALMAAWRPIGWVDHACRECLPHGEILIDGFSCAYHKAKSAQPVEASGLCCEKQKTEGPWCCYCAEHGCERTEAHQLAAGRNHE
jgi:hypothetical protein